MDDTTIPLKTLIGDLDPAACKLHCAKYNGEQHPIDALAGSWEDWVTWNRYRPGRDEFNRQFIFSLAHDRNDSAHWLFGGVFEVVGRRNEPKALSYDLKLRDDLLRPFIRRLVVEFSPPGRAVRMNMETFLDQWPWPLSWRSHIPASRSPAITGSTTPSTCSPPPSPRTGRTGAGRCNTSKASTSSTTR